MPIKTLRKARSTEELAFRARHRMRVLATLVEICRGLERMQGTQSARAACREVLVLLEQMQSNQSAGACVSGEGER